MSNRPTADELGQEFAALKQAHDLARYAATCALEQYQVDSWCHMADEFEQAMTKIRKQAWAWYRVVL